MSLEAATALAQIIPIFYLAAAIEQRLVVNPDIKGRRRIWIGAPLIAVAIVTALVEFVLVNAIITGIPPHPIWGPVALIAIGAGLLLVVMVHVGEILLFDSAAAYARTQKQRAARGAARAARRVRKDGRHEATE